MLLVWENLNMYLMSFSFQSSLPSHMPIAIGPIPPKSKPKSLPQYEELQCSLCHKHIEEEDGLYCTDEACTLVAHMICLARSFLNTPDEYIPVRGRCPECNLMLLWGDLIRARQGVWQKRTDVINDLCDGSKTTNNFEINNFYLNMFGCLFLLK